MLNPALHKEANGAGLESKRPHEKHSKPSALQTQLCGSPQGPGRPRAARTNTSFQTSKEPDHQPKKVKKASDQNSSILCNIFSNLLQYWCRDSSKLMRSAVPEGRGNHSYAKASALFSPTPLSALLVLSMHSMNFTHSNKSPASGNH